jgi:hypothetical protein
MVCLMRAMGKAKGMHMFRRHIDNDIGTQRDGLAVQMGHAAP